MQEMMIKTAVEVLGVLLVTLIGVLGTWLTVQIGRKENLASIAAATDEAAKAAQRVVLELQQTTVEAMKAASQDGKLSQAEIQHLGSLLLSKALDQMSEPAIQVLAAAGKDVGAIIKSAGEAAVQEMKK